MRCSVINLALRIQTAKHSVSNIRLSVMCLSGKSHANWHWYGDVHHNQEAPELGIRTKLGLILFSLRNFSCAPLFLTNMINVQIPPEIMFPSALNMS